MRTSFLCDHCNADIPFVRLNDSLTVKFTKGIFTGKRGALHGQPFLFQSYCTVCAEKLFAAMNVPALRTPPTHSYPAPPIMRYAPEPMP